MKKKGILRYNALPNHCLRRTAPYRGCALCSSKLFMSSTHQWLPAGSEMFAQSPVANHYSLNLNVLFVLVEHVFNELRG